MHDARQSIRPPGHASRCRHRRASSRQVSTGGGRSSLRRATAGRRATGGHAPASAPPGRHDRTYCDGTATALTFDEAFSRRRLRTMQPESSEKCRQTSSGIGTRSLHSRRNPMRMVRLCLRGDRDRPRERDMNLEKYTDRARGFVQSAQSLALREGHQQFAPEHLLKVLLDDPEGLAAGLIDRSGGNSREALRAVEAALAKRPKVEGGGAGQLYLEPALARVFNTAEKSGNRVGGSFVTVERLLLALAIEKDNEAGKILGRAGVTPQNLNAAIEALRKGRTADSANAEQAYDALKKYARDLTQAARDGKLDPVIGRDEEIRRTVQVLSRRTKNNPVLIGEPGVGKT